MSHRTEGGQNTDPERKRNIDQEENYIEKIPVIEEKLQVDKKTVETGTVRIIKKVTEEEVTIDVPTAREEVEVERVPLNKYIETPPSVRHEGETMIIPVIKEVIEKRLVLVEEVRITRRKVQTEARQQVTLRKEKVVVEREDHNLRPENKHNE